VAEGTGSERGGDRRTFGQKPGRGCRTGVVHWTNH
jgi:hypothetical protein